MQKNGINVKITVFPAFASNISVGYVISVQQNVKK